MLPFHDRSGSPSEMPVTLPSIRDIFPEYARESRTSVDSEGDHPPFERPQGGHTGRSPSSNCCDRPHHSASHGFNIHQRPSSLPRDVAQQSSLSMSTRGHHHHSRSLPLPPTMHHHHHAHSASFPFLLRPEAESTSFQQVTASTTLTSSLAKSPCMENAPALTPNVVNGSTPAFRVNVTPSKANCGVSQDAASPGQDADQTEKHPGYFDHVTRYRAAPLAPSVPMGGSAMIQFPVAGSPASFGGSATVRRPYTRRYDGQNSLDADKGKKHECPHCAKKFNRPSSLRIHVNTHTGLKPFECPFPRCGRLFNVNSNMRRHYRNHIRAGASQHEALQNDHMRMFSTFVDASPRHVASFPHAWQNERTLGGIWESIDDDDFSEDEMDELQDEDEPEHEQCENTSELASSSPS